MGRFWLVLFHILMCSIAYRSSSRNGRNFMSERFDYWFLFLSPPGHKLPFRTHFCFEAKQEENSGVPQVKNVSVCELSHMSSFPVGGCVPEGGLDEEGRDCRLFFGFSFHSRLFYAIPALNSEPKPLSCPPDWVVVYLSLARGLD